MKDREGRPETGDDEPLTRDEAGPRPGPGRYGNQGSDVAPSHVLGEGGPGEREERGG